MDDLDRSSSLAREQQWATLTHWFHRQNIAWSGTPSELFSQLSNFGEREGVFSDTSELLNVIAQNTEALLRSGIKAGIQRPPGRLVRICLESTSNQNGEERAIEPLVSEVPGDDPVLSAGGPVDQAPASALQSEEHTEPPKAEEEEGIDSFTSNLFSFYDRPHSGVNSRRTRRVALMISIAAALALAWLAVVYTHQGHRLPIQSEPEAPTAVSHATGAINPTSQNANPARDATSNEPSDVTLEILIRDAGENKSPFSEEELAMRYMDGRGTQRDPIAAYTWFVLARANGSDRDDDIIKKIGSELSQEDLQKVRLYLGNSYARGIGVPRDPVTAHSWFELAEAAGSKDATPLKRGLEASMTPKQIRQAQDRTTEWLNRHRAMRGP